MKIYTGSLSAKFIFGWRSYGFGAQRTCIECSLFEPPRYFQACTTSGKGLLIFYTNQPMENHRDELIMECPIELKDSSNDLFTNETLAGHLTIHSCMQT